MATFVFTTEVSIIGTEESAVCGIKTDGGKTITFTGACDQVEKFGITADELAVFAGEAQSVHFESGLVYIPVRDRGLNDKVLTEEISVLIVRAVRDGEVVNTAQISRVVSRW